MKESPTRWRYLLLLWQGVRGNPLALAGMITVAALCFIAVAAPWLATSDPAQFDRGRVLLGPSSEHWLGTDAVGRGQRWRATARRRR